MQWGDILLIEPQGIEISNKAILDATTALLIEPQGIEMRVLMAKW